MVMAASIYFSSSQWNKYLKVDETNIEVKSLLTIFCCRNAVFSIESKLFGTTFIHIKNKNNNKNKYKNPPKVKRSDWTIAKVRKLQ